MIWTRGAIVPDGELRIDTRDRAFEHGLGLFETFRTWDGHLTLMGRHLDRMRRSAGDLGLVVDPGDLPGEDDVRRLIAAGSGRPADAGDVRLRIVATGGVPEADGTPGPSNVWMTAGPLPPATNGGARISHCFVVDPQDPLARHKTLNYWRRRIEQARAVKEGADEALSVTPGGLICEGTRSNLFVVEGGRLITPGTEGPLLDGIMRRVVIDRAQSMGIEVVEEPPTAITVRSAEEAFLTNSVRGMLPVRWLLSFAMPAPGPITQRLWDHVLAWLNSGGIST